jgi:hypothetical protein
LSQIVEGYNAKEAAKVCAGSLFDGADHPLGVYLTIKRSLEVDGLTVLARAKDSGNEILVSHNISFENGSNVWGLWVAG